jgi:hypothetical protein
LADRARASDAPDPDAQSTRDPRGARGKGDNGAAAMGKRIQKNKGTGDANPLAGAVLGTAYLQVLNHVYPDISI